ncbi:histidine-containing phosphotransfer protein 2-like isoform X2 [Triticum dicoccoides]|uniref:histidine-containing phosphotransfer protein 2-like isoform X2 n=1 Tax=Triticum dicoccoides TaxID=85692 RepID=UPI00188F2555|nr:histidine-containing phosphotransfer protein 2-like isoform X2 [Triticum dicoccoides]
MSAAALRSQLNEHISYMYATGILDEYYQQLQSPQDEGFVPEVINIFLGDADRMLNDITSLLNLPVVDFEMVGELVHQLKACSCRCLTALNLLRNEFYDVRGRLQAIMQLEQQIAALGPK